MVQTRRRAFTIDEVVAAGAVGCRASAYKAIAEGKLRAVKSGARTLILAEDLDAYLNSLPTFVSKSRSAATP